MSKMLFLLSTVYVIVERNDCLLCTRASLVDEGSKKLVSQNQNPNISIKEASSQRKFMRERQT